MILHARVDGVPDAPPLVLLNSVGSTTQMWTPVVYPLAEQYRVVRIDHRGHGGSPPSPAGTRVTIADLGADVIATLDDLGIDRADCAGLSLGGMLGMWLAIHHPDRVGRLAMLCTSAFLPPAQGWLDRTVAVRAGGMAAIVEPVVARWVTTGGAARDPVLVQSLKTMFAGIDPESYAQCCEAIAALDLRADLARIAAPTLVLAGADDLATPPAHAEMIASAIANARLEVIADAAHIATVEQPGRVSALLLDHFRAGATLAAGYATRRAVLGDEHVDRALTATTPTTASFQNFLTRYAWGEVWARTELTRRERSIATLAALVTLGAEHELAMHVRAARRNGLTESEIVEIILHTALYAGLPRANRAIAIAADVFNEDEET